MKIKSPRVTGNSFMDTFIVFIICTVILALVLRIAFGIEGTYQDALVITFVSSSISLFYFITYK